jgi:PAS domain S-box-containing protein
VSAPSRERRAGKATGRRAVPAQVIAYTVELAALVIALAFLGMAIEIPVPISWTTFVPLIGLLVAAEYMLVRVHYRDQVLAITLFEAALAPLLFFFPIVAVIAAVAIAETITGLLRKNHPLKHAFNVVQFTTAAALGCVVFTLLRDGVAASPWNLFALAVAMSSVVAVNILTLSTVICIAEGQPLGAVLRKLAPAMLFGWTVNTVFGVLFAAAYTLSPWTIFVFWIPMLLLYSAFKGHATALADRARLAGMHRATRALAGPVDPREAIPPFLAEVRKSFDAAYAELVLREGEVRVVHSVGCDGVASYRSESQSWGADPMAVALVATRQGAIIRADDDGIAATWVRTAGHRECIAAPLVEGEYGLGVLRVYDRGGPEGFEQGGLAVLEALAGEATRAMIKSELLETILSERHKLAEIVGQASDGIMTIGPGGVIQTWNGAFERITGYTSDEMVGTSRLRELVLLDARGSEVPLARWAETDAALASEIQVETSSGQTRWLSCSYTRVADADGAPSLLIVVARDATEAREVERLKDDFVATVSHELRTPLTPIKGWAATMLQTGERLDASQREEGVKAILRHAERLENLVTNILEVTKIERGLLERREALVDVAGVVEKVVTDFRMTNPTRAIHLSVSGKGLRTKGDELWTMQIVTNLMSNALKYAPADEPVEVSVGRSNGLVRVLVVDRGPGIPPEEAETVFQRFRRLGDHMTRTTGGSGLGLYIARQLAHAVGGTLAVSTTPGGGATFTLSLPSARTISLVAAAS